MGAPVKIGMITPSVNGVLEPVTYELLRDVPNVSAHFTRIPVGEVALNDESNQQFTYERFLAAGELLADVGVDAVAWNGTAGSWMGIQAERDRCSRLQDALQTPVTSATLALMSAFGRANVKTYDLAVPYAKDMAYRIVENYAAEGYRCANAAYWNWDQEAETAAEEDDVRLRVGEACSPGAAGVAVVCTNIPAARVTREIEQMHDTLVFDSVAVTLWHCLELAGASSSAIANWGRLYKRLT
jgi:maleate isomerase